MRISRSLIFARWSGNSSSTPYALCVHSRSITPEWASVLCPGSRVYGWLLQNFLGEKWRKGENEIPDISPLVIFLAGVFKANPTRNFILLFYKIEIKSEIMLDVDKIYEKYRDSSITIICNLISMIRDTNNFTWLPLYFWEGKMMYKKYCGNS